MNNPFTTKTLEQIQSSFLTIVGDLQNLRTRNADKIDKNETKISVLSQENDQLTTENLKAQKFQQNLENLMNG